MFYTEIEKEEICEIQKAIKQAADESQEFIQEQVYFWQTMSKCESPIETLVLWEFVKVFSKSDDFIAHENGSFEGIFADNCAELEPQKQIQVGSHAFRVDFWLGVYTEESKQDVIIELDGHEFHEKTKLQAQKDKWRDRMLQKEGYKVLHFTGSEVWSDPENVISEIADIVRRSWK